MNVNRQIKEETFVLNRLRKPTLSQKLNQNLVPELPHLQITIQRHSTFDKLMMHHPTNRQKLKIHLIVYFSIEVRHYHICLLEV